MEQPVQRTYYSGSEKGEDNNGRSVVPTERERLAVPTERETSSTNRERETTLHGLSSPQLSDSRLKIKHF
jgi:hypothetical protein